MGGVGGHGGGDGGGGGVALVETFMLIWVASIRVKMGESGG